MGTSVICGWCPTPLLRRFEQLSWSHILLVATLALRFDAGMMMNRYIPFSLRLKCLFGGVLNQLGWIFFGFGMVFVWTFCLNVNVRDIIGMSKDRTTVAGNVLAIDSTSMSEGGSKGSSGRPVVGYHFAFMANGERHEGLSYSSNDSFAVGDTVPVEFETSNPKVARIEGGRFGMVSAGCLFVILFPAIGLGFVIFGLRKGFRSLKLLSRGELATARVVGTHGTGMTINDVPVLEYELAFKTRDGREAKILDRTHRGDLIDESGEERILYDPANPTNGMLVDTLPGGPQFDARGQINGSSGTILCAVIPLLVIAGNALIIYKKLGGTFH